MVHLDCRLSEEEAELLLDCIGNDLREVVNRISQGRYYAESSLVYWEGRRSQLESIQSAVKGGMYNSFVDWAMSKVPAK